MRYFRPIMLGFSLLALIAVGTASPSQAQDQQSTWEAIQERGTFRVGATQAPPWYYKDPATGEWSGLAISVAEAMAKALGVEVDVVEVTWGSAIAALQANKIDAMFVLDATPQRAMAVDFPSSPLLYYALAVLAREDLEVETWSDLNKADLTVAVTQGTTMDRYVTEHLPKAEILRFPSNGEAVAAFQSRRADVVSLFHPPLIALRKKIGRGNIVVPTPVRASASSVGVRREPDDRWVDWVGTAISYYYTTGQTQEWYEEFLRDYGLDPDQVPAIQRDLWD